MSARLPPPEAYATQLAALFPRGRAWPQMGGPNWRQLCAALAVELRRVDSRVADLCDEADPRTATEALEDFERVLGLPDACLGEMTDIEDRRRVVIALLTMIGGASPEYFEALGAAFGRPCVVEEAFTFSAGISAAGDALNDEWQDAEAGVLDAGDFLLDAAAPFFWWVTSEASWAREFSAGEAAAGDALLDFGDPLLECLIARFRPAHTIALHQFDASAALATYRGDAP